MKTQRKQGSDYEREDFLKSITPGTEIFDNDGVQLNPAIKTSTTKVVTFLL